jgi:hypothetical protein
MALVPRDFFVLAPVAQDVIDLGEHLFVIPAVHFERGGQNLAGMAVLEGEGAGIAFGDRVLQATRAGRNIADAMRA